MEFTYEKIECPGRGGFCYAVEIDDPPEGISGPFMVRFASDNHALMEATAERPGKTGGPSRVQVSCTRWSGDPKFQGRSFKYTTLEGEWSNRATYPWRFVYKSLRGIAGPVVQRIADENPDTIEEMRRDLDRRDILQRAGYLWGDVQTLSLDIQALQAKVHDYLEGYNLPDSEVPEEIHLGLLEGVSQYCRGSFFKHKNLLGEEDQEG